MNDPSGPSRVEQIFDLLLSTAPEHWQEVALAASAGDRQTAEEALSLARAASQGEEYLARLGRQIGLPAGDDHRDGPVDRRVGPYRLLTCLGRGGMGAVYLAERDDGDFAVKAAVKLLAAGLPSSHAVERFLAERRILSGLTHPNIARLFDGGITEDGLPYFVMEYVEGSPIDRYCDERRLSVIERIELFLQVCESVRYAHEKLIIHRDLKPENVLVTTEGQAKLLDFGIARALDTAADASLTRTAQPHPMTPAYASPEQVRGLPLTTATDIYGLGVLLYRLLAGRHPYPLSGLAPAEAERLIVEADPVRPDHALEGEAGSANVGPLARGPRSAEEIATARSTAVPALRRELGGDLGQIILMALRKDPERRYRSVAHLADDLTAYLERRPVSARPDSIGYRVGRFVSRNRAMVAAASVIAVLAVSLGVLGIRYTLETRAQAIRIAAEAETSNEIFDFLLDLLRLADPAEGVGDTLTVRAALANGMEAQRNRLSGRPEFRVRLLHRLAGVYNGLGLEDDAIALLQEAAAAWPETGTLADTLLGLTLDQSGYSYRLKGARETALGEYARALEVYGRVGADSVLVAYVFRGMAEALVELDRIDSARVLAGRALNLHRRLAVGATSEIVKSGTTYARTLNAAGEPDSAVSVLGNVIELGASNGASGSAMAPAVNNLGYYLRLKDDIAGAERAYRRALDEYGAWIPLSERQTVLVNLASARRAQGDSVGAVEILRQRVELALKWWPNGHWRVGSAYSSLAGGLSIIPDLAGAEEAQRAALASYRETLGPDHGWTADAESKLGAVLANLGRADEAEAHLLQSYRKLEAALGPDAAFTRAAAVRLADFYESSGRPEEAARFRRPAQGGA